MALSSADLQKMLQAIAGQAQQMGPNPNQFASQPSGQGRQKGPLDAIQGLLDLGGFVDPTPTLDWINAGISLGRSVFSKTDTERNEHLKNAAISGISGAVPYLGDMAKLGKYELNVGKQGARGGLSSILGMFGQQQGQSPFGPAQPPPPVSPPTPPAPPGGGWPKGWNRWGSIGPSTPPFAPPPIPPGGGGSPPIPPGSPPPPPPPPPPGGNTYSGAFGVGAIAGGALGAMDLSNNLSPIHHGLGTALAGPTKAAVGSDMGRMLSRPMEAIATVLNPFENPIKKLTTAVSATVMTMIEMPGALKNWGESLKESQRHLVDFNGMIAAAFMESERRDIMRGIGSGARTSGTTTGLLDALSDFKDDLQPYGDFATNSLNKIVELGLRVGTGLIKGVELVTGIDDSVAAISEWLFGKEEVKPTAGFELMDYIRKLPTAVTKPPRRR